MPRVQPVPSTALLVRQKPTGFLADFDWSLNPYSGCVFQCGGCYVPDLLCGRAERLGGWGSYVEARVRSLEVLRRSAEKLRGSTWFMSPVSDVYQPAERRYRLTRSLLEELRSIPFAWGLLSTRSPLILEDLDLLRDLRDRVEVGVSIPTDLEEVRRRLDPKNPPVRARLETCRRLREAGIPVRIHVAPMQPHSPEFPKLAGEVADWAWLDPPAHLRLARPAYQAAGVEEALSPDWARRQFDAWRSALGEERVGFGQADFSRRSPQASRSGSAPAAVSSER